MKTGIKKGKLNFHYPSLLWSACESSASCPAFLFTPEKKLICLDLKEPQKKPLKAMEKREVPPGPEMDHQCAVCSQFLHCCFTVLLKLPCSMKM